MTKKRYAYSYDDYEDNHKNVETMVTDILADPDLAKITEIEIGSWGDAWEDSCQAIIDDIIINKEAFDHIEKLAIGIMDYEECEMSWIMQGNYSKLWAALPNLKGLTIQGSSNLELGHIQHEQLEQLEIICGGLPLEILQSVAEAQLPKLKELVLYFGVEDYGMDAELDDVKEMLGKMNFPELTHLGLVNSEAQNALAEIAVGCHLMPQLTTLALSCGTLTDEGGQVLLDAIPRFPNIKKLDLHYHYLSDEMMGNLAKLPIEVDLSEQNEAEKYGGELYYSPMITE